LTRFNPVGLEFWKHVWFTSDEFIDFAVVERFPQDLFFQRKIFKLECSLFNSLEAFDVSLPLSSSFMAAILIGSASLMV
jgi:hypothetical protein